MVARSDKVTDPAIVAGLLLARRGQAYFSRKLNELADEDLDAPSLVPGWSRAHVAAHVGLNARALTRLTQWAATGAETPMYASPAERDREIEFAATLPPRAIRTLSAHAAVHLTVEWRDLEPDAWHREVRTARGRLVPVSETVWMRTREVWVHAVDLADGGRFTDFPPELLDALLRDVAGAWRARGEAGDLVLAPSDRDLAFPVSDVATREVSGTAAQLVAWATGRLRDPGDGPVLDGGAPPPAPRWL